MCELDPRDDGIVEAPRLLAAFGSLDELSRLHGFDDTMTGLMGRPIFTVRGRIASSDGAPVADAYVAIVDADPDLDDLLGAGATAVDGSFRLSFTTEAFNQERLEAETTPDLYVVVSLPSRLAGAGSTVLEPALRRDFGNLAFANAAREEDLGTIVIPPPTLAAPLGGGTPLRVAPGRGKIAKRLRLDDELVDIAAREIAPLVERLTGWSGLCDGVGIRIVDAYRDVQRERIQRELGRHDLDRTQLALIEASAKECEASIVASWQPDEGVILLNRTLIEEQPFDFLKVTIGHELVHVGQTRMVPSLGATLLRTRVEQWQKLLEGQQAPRAQLREVLQLLTNIEGYAHYIERRWLRRIYTHAGELPRPTSEADAYFRWRAAPAMPVASAPAEPTTKSPAEMLEAILADKGAQYVLGENFYRMRADGDRPAPFDPDLRCDESNAEEMLGALMLFQAEAEKNA